MKKNINKKIQEKKDSVFDLTIIDGPNRCHKYYHRMSFLKNSKGITTGMYHGFLGLVLKIKKENPKKPIVVVWESERLERKAQMDCYKENRNKEDRSEYYEQEKILKIMLDLMGIRQYYSIGNEADDIAITIVNKNRDKKILLISEDRDWYDAFNYSKNVSIMKKIKSQMKTVNYEQLKKIECFPPEHYMLYVIMRGKAANNVNGISGFPEELALEVLNKCDSIDSIIKYKTPGNTKYDKYLNIFQDKKIELKEKHKIISLRNNIPKEELKWKEKNLKKLMEMLVNLELKQVKSNLESLLMQK